VDSGGGGEGTVVLGDVLKRENVQTRCDFVRREVLLVNLVATRVQAYGWMRLMSPPQGVISQGSTSDRLLPNTTTNYAAP
jgi:hypothetical protein